jgi:RNA polymerase subunit RPABC4/transcription elongation factor Spt4
MSPELINTIGTIVGVLVAAFGAFLFAFWIAIGIWTFNDIRIRTRDWLVIILAVTLVLIFPVIGWILYLMIRPKQTLADVYDRALEEEALLRELEETQACTNCGVPVKEAWVYCPNCHNQLQHSCPTCGKLVRNEWEICVFCGAAQRAVMPQVGTVPTVAPQVPRSAATTASRPMPSPQTVTATAAPAGVPPAVAPTVAGQPRSSRNPFQRPATPAGTSSLDDFDDGAYRPVSMPD